MIYLSIPVLAAQQELNINKLSVVASNKTSGTTKYTWKQTTLFPYSFYSNPSNTIAYFYMVAELDAIPNNGQILVWTFDLQGAAWSENIAQSRVGFVPDTFTSVSQSIDTLVNYNYDQYVLATTHQKMTADTIRYTVTTELVNPSSKNIIWNIGTIGLLDTTQDLRLIVQMHIYDSVEDAAGSGTTPEEMRNVLSSWGEEELLPGIQDSVQSGVAAGMEEALENEKQEASSDGAGNAEQLQGAIDEALGDIEEVQKPFETLGSALSYNGQSATLTFPGMNVPFLGQISQPVSVNLTQKITEIMPTELLNIIRGVLSLALVVFPPLEVIRLFNKLLNKG